MIFSSYSCDIKPLPFLSNLAHTALKMFKVCYPILRSSSFCEVLKLSKIIATNKFRKMNETITIKLIK